MSAGPLLNRVVADRYRLVAQLGAGAMGTVWLAHDRVLDTEVALKEIGLAGGLSEQERAERVERALREARHTARLRGHPHVVTVHDVVPENGLPWIVMEYVPSRSLFQVVRDDGPLPVPEVARIGLALVDALSAAHERGILHRDVKPSNVLVGEAGRIVLTDFGIATHDGDPTLTVTGLVGTPMYMAPERLDNTPATPRADLFGLGATLYFAVEGDPPFKRDSFGAMLTAILLHPPMSMRRAGPLEEVILGLLEKNPNKRLTAHQAQRMFDALTARPAAAPPAAAPLASSEAAAGVVRAEGIGWRSRQAPHDPVPAPEAPDATAPEDSGAPKDPDVPDGPSTVTMAQRAASRAGGPGSPLPPLGLTTAEEDGMVVLRWSPSSSPGVSYRVTRVVEDPASPTGRRERSLGTTWATELTDAGVPKGVPVWHEVTSATADDVWSVPVRTPTLVVLPDVAALRADMAGDAVALSWRAQPGFDDVIIERRHASSSSTRGAMRIFYASQGQFVDHAAQPGATYRYRVRIEQTGAGGVPRHSPGCEVEVAVVARPRAVTDLEVDASAGQPALRWTSVPGAAVRVYATPTPAVPGLAGTSPFGPPDHEVSASSLEGRARLAGESRRGRLMDTSASGDTVYTPVSVAGDRAVIGVAVRDGPL